MVNQYDKIDLCAQVQNGKVRYFKEYSLKGRIVRAECIPFAEFARLSDQQYARRSQAQTAQKQ